MKLTIEIQLDNPKVADDPKSECARILQRFACALIGGEPVSPPHPLYDLDAHFVGMANWQGAVA